MMRKIVLSFCLCLLSLPLLTVTTATQAQTFRNGNWRGQAIFVGGRFDRCEISVGFVDGRRLYIAQLRSRSIAIAIGKKDAWTLQPRTRGWMTFEFYKLGRDNKRTKTYTQKLQGRTIRNRPSQFWFLIGRDLRFVNQFQTSDILYVSDSEGIIEGTPKRYGHRLNNVRSAMLKLSICTLLYSTR